MLTELEGKRNAKYLDQAGLPTIGVGHLLTKSELSSGKIQLGGIPIRWTEGLTDAEVDAILAHDVEDTVEVVEAQVAVPLSQPQFDALVSFAFNIGGGPARTMSLVELVDTIGTLQARPLNKKPGSRHAHTVEPGRDASNRNRV